MSTLLNHDSRQDSITHGLQGTAPATLGTTAVAAIAGGVENHAPPPSV